MALSSRSVSVGTTPTRLSSAPTDSVPVASISVFNAGSATVFLGGSGVTAAAGYSLPAAQHFATDIDPSEQLWAIAAAGTVEVRVIEVGA